MQMQNVELKIQFYVFDMVFIGEIIINNNNHE